MFTVSQYCIVADDKIVVFLSFQKFMSYGFSKTDRYEDVATTHIMMFMTITFTMTIGFVIFTYGPEKK